MLSPATMTAEVASKVSGCSENFKACHWCRIAVSVLKLDLHDSAVELKRL